MNKAVIRETVRAALREEWFRRIEEQIKVTPEEHVEGFTDAIMKGLGRLDATVFERTRLPSKKGG